MTEADIERGLVARYAARVLSRGELPARSARQITYWLFERADFFGIPFPSALARFHDQPYGSGIKMAEYERAFARSSKALIQSLDTIAGQVDRPEPLASNIERMIRVLNIANPDAALRIVGLIACCARYELVQYFANTVQEAANPMSRAIGLLVGESAHVVEDCLAPAGDLIGAGLVQIDDGDYIGGHGARYAVPFRINLCLDRTYADFTAMREALLGVPLTTSGVGPDDYEHVTTDRDLIISVLQGGTRERAAGINILLYGPPGSGKTELSKVAARAAGLTLYAAGEEGQHSSEQNRRSRLTDLVFSLRLLAGDTSTALLFDEMEDVALQLIRRGGSKVYFNRLLETNPIPVIWTCNELGSIDPAVLRRMTLAIELKRPPAAQRRRIIAQLLKRYGVEIDEGELGRLAEHLDATPAIIENAIRAARFAGGGAATVERAARGIMRAVTGLGARRIVTIPSFDPGLTVADRDLIALADQLVGGNARAFSLCLFGPPGTGKSAFARYLAGRLGLQITHIRASDILGMYVGQSERNIAEAFEEARENGTFLVFDEADSLLLDRRGAHHSWEVTQVNEMLTWMEDHPLPVCFTTNLMDRVDQASLRRFTFSVGFNHLNRRGLERAWRVFFGITEPPPNGVAFANLAPGDFAKARKQAEMLGILDMPDDLEALLADISRSKPDAAGALGFMG